VEDRWAVQVFAAYEAKQAGDYDPPLGASEHAILGMTAEGSPANIFLETIRDVSANTVDAVDAETLRQRTVVHETLHRFGIPDSTIAGIMRLATNVLGTADENKLKGSELRAIVIKDLP
jgi:hypothetical protein